jgi:hypothetical protein
MASLSIACNHRDRGEDHGKDGRGELHGVARALVKSRGGIVVGVVVLTLSSADASRYL